MFRLEWLFLMQLVMGVLMVIFLQKLTQIKKQVDEITKEVMNYISYVTDDLEEEPIMEKSSPQNEFRKKENGSRIVNEREKEDAQNRLIQAVLGEYFQ